MERVENFRDFQLYLRSMDLTRESYEVIHVCKEELTDKEVALIRKMAVTIPIKIASAIGQVNMKVRFKMLNNAKVILIQLRATMMEFNKKKKVDDHSLTRVNGYLEEILKLLYGYFGWISNEKAK
ncbi:four helix bundle protein [Fictibacillus phosphorivorans]|uniref:four helix bundle protein n=1 Tax=Fictibacillus phosphorivorans TaxID=1221500 RepID=UPI001293749D|nr:four helix bundle protein [Fictibacillus phosphorivorans]MQR93689.1 hypothetical protein [Fictibacillus phosphorivorans]